MNVNIHAQHFFGGRIGNELLESEASTSEAPHPLSILSRLSPSTPPLLTTSADWERLNEVRPKVEQRDSFVVEIVIAALTSSKFRSRIPEYHRFSHDLVRTRAATE